MSNYHPSNVHQSPFLISQMYPGFVEPPPPYGAATAPASQASPSAVGQTSNGRGEQSSTCAAFAGDHNHQQQQHLATDKFHSSAEQQTNNTNASSNGTNCSSGGGGHQHHLPYYHPQMPSAQQQTTVSAASETPVLPPGAVPFAMHPPPVVNGIYSSQSISTGHSLPIGGPNQAQIVKMIIAVPLGPHEMQLNCSNCCQSVRTRVVSRPGLLTWIICGALALIGCWPCCVLPFCAQSCQDAEHYCTNCNAFIGKYSRI